MGYKAILAAAAICFSGAAAEAVPVQWTSGVGANFHWYEIVTSSSRISWSTANAAAASSTHAGLTGHLGTITSAEEQAFLDGLKSTGSSAWLGGSDAASEGTWTWVTGETWAYDNWASGEPNNVGSAEHYLVGWWSSNQWNDLPDANLVFEYVVEYDAISSVPLPAGLPLALGAIGALGLVGRRRKSK